MVNRGATERAQGTDESSGGRSFDFQGAPERQWECGVNGRETVDFGEMVREGLARAGSELQRLRRIAELQANITTVKLRRRGQREALTERVLALYRRGELAHPDLIPLCESLEAAGADLRDLEDQLSAVRHSVGAPENLEAVEPVDPLRPAGEAGGVVVLPSGERLCAVCRTELGEGATFCPTCGIRV